MKSNVLNKGIETTNEDKINCLRKGEKHEIYKKRKRNYLNSTNCCSCNFIFYHNINN